MAEAEDVIVDAARHATVFARDLWRRHRPAEAGPALPRLAEVASRLDLFLAAALGRGRPIRVAQPPAPPSFLQRLRAVRHGPRERLAVPATDGEAIWLPDDVAAWGEAARGEAARGGAARGGAARDEAAWGEAAGHGDAAAVATDRWRAMALQQAMRAARGAPAVAHGLDDALLRDVFLLVEAHAADAALVRLLPGLAPGLAALRRDALARRPAPGDFPTHRQPLERLAATVLALAPGAALGSAAKGAGSAATGAADGGHARDSIEPARALARELRAAMPGGRGAAGPLFKDWWTGELRAPSAAARIELAGGAENDDGRDRPPPRSARLSRAPRERRADPDEDDDEQPGAWMVQTAQPQEHAEDPVGMQRPTDRDESTAAEEFADSLSELPEARLVSTPGRPREVLLSDDAPEPRARRAAQAAAPGADDTAIRYPEWDWSAGAYAEPGATVRLLPAAEGDPQWATRILAERRAMLDAIRRRFEMLRARRVRVRRQLDGEDIDLDAWVDAQGDWRAGRPLEQALYQSERRARRDAAIALLIDVSGSTDAWVAGDRRVIDVEREALLLVCIALDGLGEPYTVQAFSGEGPQAVTVRTIKRFDERWSDTVARRIAALEPERYTRAGAAIRHATATLMREPARHRLLVLLSDGKPNDIDRYDGRYGVEDMRQAVIESRLQGVSPFCLTIDRQAAGYLPQVFGAGQYALLPRPELLPTVLLDWMRRLVTD